MNKQKIISGIVAGTLVFALAVAPVYGATLSEQLAESNARQTEAKFQVDMTQNTITGIETEINKVNDEVNRISGVIDSINIEVAGLESNIAKTQEELNIAEAKRLEQEGAMSDRVRTMYMYGNGSIMEYLFSSTDFSDFATKLDMSRYIIEADKSSLKALEETKKVIDEKKQSIESDRLKTVAKAAEQETALGDQENVKAQKDQLLAQNQTVLTQYKAIEDAEAATSADIEGQIQAYYAEQAAQAAAKQAAAEQAAAEQAAAEQGANNDTSGGSTDNNNTGSSSDDNEPAASPSYSSGYQWPCGGSITSPFGNRDDPMAPGSTRFHSGVDIGASTGTPVAAAGNGVVISSGYNGGYGNCVIIDLGNGISALYAHMSSINVSAGQSISSGQTVGAVGSTGNSTGAHLHFEMRNYGTAVDPNTYF
ncbi:murein hydrolase activator EnvC family protein [Acetobacterium sp.]|uniref:murein hydrolase activator EnvC family protein n=1 Tax=Acetobacterium sp. TaxID=1872094 RepID=UPI002F3F4136